MMKLKDGSSVDGAQARTVLGNLRILQRENPNLFVELVEDARKAKFRYGDEDATTKELRRLEFLEADRSVRGLVAAVIASAVEQQDGKLIIGTPFEY